MQIQIIYQFPSAQVANRFLNDANSAHFDDLKAKLHRGSDKVLITYSYANKGFDTTGSELDDLAARYDGKEVG